MFGGGAMCTRAPARRCRCLGHGKDSSRGSTRDAAGGIDLDALSRRLSDLDGAPAVHHRHRGRAQCRASFDPLADLAELAERHRAWLHVDGAFGLFAALSPSTAHLVTGLERVDSIAADAHKWLNVPYESGFALIRSRSAFRPLSACRGPHTYPDRTTPAVATAYWVRSPLVERGPCRLGHAGSVWAGRIPGAGRAPLRPGRHLAAAVDAAPDLERLSEVP